MDFSSLSFILAFILTTVAPNEDSFTETVLALAPESSERFSGSVDSANAVQNSKVTKKNAAPVTTTGTLQNTTIKPSPERIVNQTTIIDCKNITNDLLNTDPDYCCLAPIIFSQETVYKCQISNRQHVDWFYDDPPENECVVQCMFETNHLLDNTTIINKDVLINLTLSNRYFDRPLWQPILRQSIDECLKTERMNFNATGPVACSPRPYIILQCLYVEMMKNCPADSLSSEPKCSDLKSFSQTCNDIPKHKTYIYN